MHYKNTSSPSGQNALSIAKRTSQIMKYGQDVIIQNRHTYSIQNGKWY